MLKGEKVIESVFLGCGGPWAFCRREDAPRESLILSRNLRMLYAGELNLRGMQMGIKHTCCKSSQSNYKSSDKMRRPIVDNDDTNFRQTWP